MHPRLEQFWELKSKGKGIWALEAEYRAAQEPSEVPKMKPQHEDQKASFHPAAGSPRKTKPPTDPEALRRALEEDRAAEAARRNAPRRFDQCPGYPNDTPIRMVTNPWLSAQSKEQYSVVPGRFQPPTGPRNSQSGRRWSNYQPAHRQSTRQQWNHHQPQHRWQQADQQQPNAREPKAQQSKPEQSKPSPPKPEQPEQPSNNSSHDQKSGKNQANANRPATLQSHQQPQGHAPSHNASDDQPTTPALHNESREKKSKDHRRDDAKSPPRKTLKEKRREQKEKKREKRRQGDGDTSPPRKLLKKKKEQKKKKSKNHRQEDDATSPPRELLEEQGERKHKKKKKKSRPTPNKEELEEPQPREEQTSAVQEPSEQNEGEQTTDPNAGRPVKVKEEEESDAEQLPSLSAQFQAIVARANPKTSAGARADEVPGRWENRPLPTEAHAREQHDSISTSFEERPFPRSPSYGTCAFTSPPPQETNQIPQPASHAPTTPTTSARQPGMDGASPETSALARAIAQEMTDKLHAVHLSITDQFEAQSKEISDQLEKQITKQKRRMLKLKEKTKLLTDKIEGQTEMLKRQKTWMKKRSRTAAKARIQKRRRPSRATEEWEYIHAPIVGHSDDSTDETYILSSSDEEEQRERLSTIDEEDEEAEDEEEDDDEEDEEDEEEEAEGTEEDEENTEDEEDTEEDENTEEEEDTDEDEDSDETDSEDELSTGSLERHTEDDILPSIETRSEFGSESGSDESGSDEPPTPPRKLKRGRAGEATEQSAGPRSAKKRRHGKAKETPVVNPYLGLIAHEREKAAFGASRVGRCRCFRC